MEEYIHKKGSLDINSLAARKETESSPSDVTEETQETTEDQESEVVEPVVPESNDEESVSKDEAEEEDSASGSTQSTFSYEQLRARSENPVTGIDFKRREVGPPVRSIMFLIIYCFEQLVILTCFTL